MFLSDPLQAELFNWIRMVFLSISPNVVRDMLASMKLALGHFDGATVLGIGWSSLTLLILEYLETG